MSSLKYKLIIAMFFTSVISISIIFIISPAILKERFIQYAKNAHYINFVHQINDYKSTHKEWGTKKSAKEFSKNERNKPPHPGDIIIKIHQNKFRNKKSENKSHRSGKEKLPFRLGLIDNNGFTLIGFRNYKGGDKVPTSLLKKADPLYLNNKIVAYAIPEGPPKLTPRDQMYFDGLYEALAHAILAAIIITLLLGLFWGNQLTKSLRKLTVMAQSLRVELKEQQVEIKSKDEIGILARVFNNMSLDLTKAHNDLKTSNLLIREQADRLKELAIRDELTKLYNRRFFNEQVKILHENAKRYKHPMTIVLGDIDLFKKINDNFSHIIGDKVLVQVSKIIGDSLRSGDILARYGGEEMIIALPETKPENAFEIMNRIRLSIENFNWIEIAEGLQVTMSFGLCTDYNLPSFESMTVVADENLYKAKEAGRNRVIWKS